MNQNAPLVCARNVQKHYGDNQVLEGGELDVYPGEVVVILRPSSFGRSTLLRCINDFEEMNDGSIRIGNGQIGSVLKGHVLHRLPPRQIAHQRQKIGMVFQLFNLSAYDCAAEHR